MLFFVHIRVIYFNLRCQKTSVRIVFLLFFLFSSPDQIRVILRLLKLCPCASTELRHNKVEIAIALSKSKSYQVTVQQRSSAFGHCGRRNESVSLNFCCQHLVVLPWSPHGQMLWSTTLDLFSLCATLKTS